MKILLAIDSSEASCRMVDEVARRPWPSPTTACVLHVIDWPQLPSGASLIQSFRESAETLVNSACARLEKAGLHATGKVFEGHPRTAIADYAAQWAGDLVLVGYQGVSGLAHFLLGSVAQAVLRGAPCSVEIVRKPASAAVSTSGAMKILVATDGSECSMGAVRSVAERPWPSGSLIRVISVIPVILAVGSFHPVPPLYLPSEVSSTRSERSSKARRGGYLSRPADS